MGISTVRSTQGEWNLFWKCSCCWRVIIWRTSVCQVNVSGSGSGGASSGGQVSACAGEERPSLFSDSGNRFSSFNPFAAAIIITASPAERYEAEFMGASEFLNRRVNEELQRAFEAGVTFIPGISITRSISHWNPK